MSNNDDEKRKAIKLFNELRRKCAQSVIDGKTGFIAISPSSPSESNPDEPCEVKFRWNWHEVKPIKPEGEMDGEETGFAAVLAEGHGPLNADALEEALKDMTELLMKYYEHREIRTILGHAMIVLRRYSLLAGSQHP